MQRDFGLIQKLRMATVHMGHLAALLAGVEPGSRGLEARTLLRAPNQFRNSRCRARIQPQPSVRDGFGPVADQPSAVSLPGEGHSGNAGGQIVDLVRKPSQRRRAIGPSLL